MTGKSETTVAAAALPVTTVNNVKGATMHEEIVAVTRAVNAARAIVSAWEIATAAGFQVEMAVDEAVVASEALGAIGIATVITTDQTGSGPIGMIGQSDRTTVEVVPPRTGASLRRTR